MKLSDLSTEQIRRYFLSRLPNVKPTANQVVRCPWHDDRHESLSLSLDKGAWKCHAGCGEGGLVDFEARFSGSDRQAALHEIFRVLGIEIGEALFREPTEKPEAIYSYRDASGLPVLEKVRFPGKRFIQRKRSTDGRTWEYRLGNIRKPLYHLPELITANYVLVCEGEKDADNLTALNLSQGPARIVATTGIDGAGKWNATDSAYFAGKQVVILPDNDPPGQKHAGVVAASVSPYALAVKIVNLPGLPVKGDVSDYLADHSALELLAEIKKAPVWKPPQSSLLVDAETFDKAYTPEIEWLVDGVIQRGANGFICAAPKSGKSWLAADLAMSVAVGRHWMGFRVSKECRVALISREDNPALTKWRLRQLASGRGYELGELGEQLWINSKDQSPQFRLDNPEHLAEMTAALRDRKPELVILDVLNVLHTADENDNTEMRTVLDKLNVIHQETGASLCVLHHFNKMEKGSLTARLRGSSAIAGWAEWLIGIEGEENPRKAMFELKASSPPESVHFRIRSGDGEAAIEICEAGAQTARGGREALLQ